MQTLDLCGQWRLTGGNLKRSVAAAVPGCVHTDLLAAGHIPDPFYRDNEDHLRWIGRADWSFGRTFQVPAKLLNSKRVLLRCEGLDTLATIRINGKRLAQTDNMYRTYEFDVKPLLKAGTNRIAVDFASAENLAAASQKKRPMLSFPGPKEPAGRSHIRKQPCNFGWDWGPVLITCGIWRKISIVAFDVARLEDVHVVQDHSKAGLVGMKVKISAEAVGRPALNCRVTVSLAGKVVQQATAALKSRQAQIKLLIKNPQLWWPNNMGRQPLYDVQVELLDDVSKLDDKSLRIGLRTLGLDRHTDKWGESFQFMVNGLPFFAKGANWIPADAFVTRLDRSRYERLLKDAAAANMNMLRVWGGGVYESEDFYDLCDELGLCVWQDFMFACAMYPASDKSFKANVREEARQVVRQLRHHASLALWCGNNELEQCIIANVPGDIKKTWEEYSILFDELLPEIVAELDGDRDYWPSSPHKPFGNRLEVGNPDYGDAHLWDVWHGRKPFEWYRTCTHRFNSEFGFQSFPHHRTVESYASPEDQNITSYVMEHHQRSGPGNAIIMHYMLDWFRLPTSFHSTLMLSQILQGMAIKYAVEHWRRSMPRGMGTLYWQINDNWPVASWSSIDYFGRWKALHYMARNFFAPLLVSGLEDAEKGTVELHVTSDLAQVVKPTIHWEVTDTSGKSIQKGKINATAAPNGNTHAGTLDLNKHTAVVTNRQLLLWLHMETPGQKDSSNLVLLSRPKHLALQAPEIATSVKANGEGEFVVTLEAKKPALWTSIDLDQTDADFSDNYFHIKPGRGVVVTVKPKTQLTLQQFQRQLQVSSLFNTYA